MRASPDPRIVRISTVKPQFVVLLPALLLLGCYDQPTGEMGLDRDPAPVTGFESAEWLERGTREIEERPDLVLAAMDLRNGDLVAEIGSGTGYFTRRMAREVAPDGEVWAVDIQKEMLDELRRRTLAEGLDNVVPVLGEADDPLLPRAMFDWIVLVDTYHEIQQPRPMLERIRESLAPGGRVALVEYRLEGATAEHISLRHRMSVNQILTEWVPAGFDLVERIDALPSQHLLIFAPSEE